MSTTRIAVAKSVVSMSSECFKLVTENNHKKGDVLTVSKIAGIQVRLFTYL